MTPEPPFTNAGIDFFGPFYVKRGRGQEKKYGVVFSCLVTRAVHIEVADSLSTDSFLCALRRFLARRGQVKRIRTDRGTNFTGGERELAAEVDRLMKNESVLHDAMLRRDIEWILNVPNASHHGGVWERMIRSIRKVLDSLLVQQMLTDEALRTLLCEVESVLNSRPLSSVSHDHRDPLPLSPNDLLLLGGAAPSPGEFPESLDQKTCTAADGGDRYSTWQTYSGSGGLKNTSRYCRADRSGSIQRGR